MKCVRNVWHRFSFYMIVVIFGNSFILKDFLMKTREHFCKIEHLKPFATKFISFHKLNVYVGYFFFFFVLKKPMMIELNIKLFWNLSSQSVVLLTYILYISVVCLVVRRCHVFVKLCFSFFPPPFLLLMSTPFISFLDASFISFLEKRISYLSCFIIFLIFCFYLFIPNGIWKSDCYLQVFVL